MFSLEIPELSQRKDDIPLLISYFISHQKNSIFFTEEAIEFLREYSWSGNIRELRNLIDRLSILSDTSTIDIHTLKKFLSPTSARKKDSLNTFIDSILDMPEPKDKLTFIENMFISYALDRSEGNKSKAAILLGVNRKAVERKLSKIENDSQKVNLCIKKAKEAMDCCNFKKAISILETIVSQNGVINSFRVDDSILCNINYLLGI